VLRKKNKYCLFASVRIKAVRNAPLQLCLIQNAESTSSLPLFSPIALPADSRRHSLGVPPPLPPSHTHTHTYIHTQPGHQAEHKA